MKISDLSTLIALEKKVSKPIGFNPDTGDRNKYISGDGTLVPLAPTIQPWQPTLTGEPPLVTLDSLVDLGEGTTGQSFTDTSVTNGTETDIAIAVSTPLSTPLSGKYGLWAKYENVPEDEGEGIVLYYYQSLFITEDDLTSSNKPVLALAYLIYVTGQGLVDGSGAEPRPVYIADWNPREDSICTVYDADNKTLEYFTNRDTTTPLLSFDLVALGITDVPYACVLSVTGYGNTVSGVKTFDLPDVQSVFYGAVGIDETDLPENAADNFFRVAGLEAPTLLPSLDKLVANNDIVAFDGTGAPSQVIQDTDLSGYATTSSVNDGLATKITKPTGFDPESGDADKYISGKGTLEAIPTGDARIGALTGWKAAQPNLTIGSTPIGREGLVAVDKGAYGVWFVYQESSHEADVSATILDATGIENFTVRNAIVVVPESTVAQVANYVQIERGEETDSNIVALRTSIPGTGTDGGSVALRTETTNKTTTPVTTTTYEIVAKDATLNGNPLTYLVAVPASPTATGKVGQLAADANYIYYCYAPDSWAKVPKADFTSGGFDANKITSGILDIARIPPAAIERMHSVADDTARFALTTADVQNGDTVKVVEDDKLYLVVDDTQLATENGYLAYTSGTDLRNLNLRTYKESVSTITSASTVLTLDFDNANNFNVAALAENTTVAFSNVSAMSDTITSFTLHIKQDATGGRTISWPASVKKVNPFTGVDTSADTVNIFEGYTLDNGTTWFVSFVGAV